MSPAQGSSGPVRVLWAPAPASRCRTAPGAPHVPTTLDQRKNVGLSSSETELQLIFFSTRRSVQGGFEGSTCPRGSGSNEHHRADAEDLAEPGRCKATPIRSNQNRAQGAAADSYQIDPDLICGGPAVADQKAAAARLGDSDDSG
jgi:hypothetical protein